ncbi:cupin [Asanoa sp. WMMD1127]|uniref:cupin domain-containing protein n=1 Tax=Asanoa sp. WMMD1127 TaxID=3016107 RepID=UPI002416F639|nr:cupin [Asanoa sp. WMMD1127]MDG4826440.1 cupin [Asanoa sp. WMMD1127]
MNVIRHDQTRRAETPAGVMTTLASPTLGGATRPVWRVEMPAGSAGPVHTIDTEQIWTVLSGGAAVRLGAADPVGIATGDTLILAPDVERQLTADATKGLTAIVTSAANSTATAGVNRVRPPWTV